MATLIDLVLGIMTSSSTICCRWFMFQVYRPFSWLSHANLDRFNSWDDDFEVNNLLQVIYVSNLLSFSMNQFFLMIIPFVQESIANSSGEMLLQNQILCLFHYYH